MYQPELFNLEKKLIEEINHFNTIYYEYVRCLSGGSNCTVGTPVTEEKVISASHSVNERAEELKIKYESQPNYTSDTHESIMNKAKQIDELRRTIDTKMETILKNKNLPNELTRQYDSTVYTGIVWSILATSVLFYIFTEM